MQGFWTLWVARDLWLQEHPPPGLAHMASHSPTPSPRSFAGVAFFSLLATTQGREGTIRLEVLMDNFGVSPATWGTSGHLSFPHGMCLAQAAPGQEFPSQGKGLIVGVKSLDAWSVGSPDLFQTSLHSQGQAHTKPKLTDSNPCNLFCQPRTWGLEMPRYSGI